jgi:hypothetical protein
MKWRALLPWCFAAALFIACGGVSDEAEKTAFLADCEVDSDCRGGVCLSGACTVTCESDRDCDALDEGAACASEADSAAPESSCASAPRDVCLPRCEENADCAGLGLGYSCQTGLCTPALRCAEPICGAMDARSSGDDCVRLEGYAWDGAECTSVNCGCTGTDCADLFATRSACLDVYGACHTGGLLPFCEQDGDCQSDERCLSGTCAEACTSSGDCDADSRCYFEETATCLLAVVDPASPGEGGECLPRCATDEDCTAVAPGLSCWGQSCVRSLPECETRCPKIADSCPEGCEAISGQAYDSHLMCRSSEVDILGCTLGGRLSTSDDSCVKSIYGVYAGISGTHAGQLMKYGNGEYGECSAEEITAASEATLCP